MYEEIKITDRNDNIIKPPTDDLIVILVNGKKQFISKEEAENNLRILKGQLLIMEKQQHGDRKTGH